MKKRIALALIFGISGTPFLKADQEAETKAGYLEEEDARSTQTILNNFANIVGHVLGVVVASKEEPINMAPHIGKIVESMANIVIEATRSGNMQVLEAIKSDVDAMVRKRMPRIKE